MDTITHADVMDYLSTLPDDSVHCVVTSPPYFRLRDYGAAGQIGSEPTPQEFVATMVAVFTEVRRVLRPDGTLWLNLGDSYASGEVGRHDKIAPGDFVHHDEKYTGQPRHTERLNTGLPAKNLLGIPWRVALALQESGWYLRSDIVWAKPNAMPESVVDRPARVHEYIFLLTKQPHYWYDYMAIRDPAVTVRPSVVRGSKGTDTPNTGRRGEGGDKSAAPFTHRNARSLWTISTSGTPLKHFAMFPRELVKRCLDAGCPAKVCAKCGAPYVRALETHRHGKGWNDGDKLTEGNRKSHSMPKDYQPPTTRGWTPTCECGADTDHGIVLDPFMGSGTTALVARSMDRHWLGCDLNAEYVALANKRLADSDPFEDKPVAPNTTQLSMFT